jgi:CheY-like chemotaxis protein
MVKILVVDDEKICQELAGHVLTKAGYEIYLARNGKEGVEMALKIQPDLILMDMDMPVMDGYEAVEILRKQNYSGLIAAFTGTSSANHEKIITIGCDCIISKLVSSGEILKKVKAMVEGSE